MTISFPEFSRSGGRVRENPRNEFVHGGETNSKQTEINSKQRRHFLLTTFTSLLIFIENDTSTDLLPKTGRTVLS